MNTLDRVRKIVDDYCRKEEIVRGIQAILAQAKHTELSSQCSINIDLQSDFGKFLCKMLEEKLPEVDKSSRAAAAMADINYILKCDKRKPSNLDIFEEKLNRHDLSGYLRDCVRMSSNRIYQIILYLNGILEDGNLPFDETAFANYLLRHYVITINFLDQESYIDQSCLRDIRKKG